MMTLADAASFFDRTAVLHPDTDAHLFYGQVDPYDDSRRDAIAAYRRILSVAPGTSVPSAIKIFGNVFLVGGSEVDGLESEHREKYVIQQADAKASVHRLPGFLAGTVASQVWAKASWEKDGKELEASDAALQIFDILVPMASDVRVHDIVTLAGSTYIVHSTRPGGAGFLMVSAYKLDQTTPAASSLVSRTYDPVSGSYVSAAAVTPNCLRVRWQFLFRYDSREDAANVAGDAAFVLPSGTSITTASRITLAGAEWKVVSVDSIDGAVVAHVRPV